MICNDCKKIEADIIQTFKTTFVQKKEIGTEYFGDYKHMIKLIFNEIYNETININEIINTNHTNIKLNEHVDENVSEITQKSKIKCIWERKFIIHNRR